MSSSILPISTYKANNNLDARPSRLAPIINIGLATVISILLLSTTGCSTTQEFKPTASVIVGGHKTI
ncbi:MULTISPECIES: hypothetical protein [unclassified Psychrobacter]|uniref:hypothetical protein n=1 Tax=unclassified Psychrobacter TaxID=196806 RepID=UPI00071E6C99|nr:MULTISPECIES: hypothetical protein [unclassified Psychrobacter]OLF38285.1 hypothetical protein BTV98_05485 [Psychrobacter sp. Cmf 22.2]